MKQAKIFADKSISNLFILIRDKTTSKFKYMKKLNLRRIFSAFAALALIFVPLQFVLADSGIGLSAYSGQPQTITVSGWGFTAGEQVNIYFNNASSAAVAQA